MVQPTNQFQRQTQVLAVELGYVCWKWGNSGNDWGERLEEDELEGERRGKKEMCVYTNISK